MGWEFQQKNNFGCFRVRGAGLRALKLEKKHVGTNFHVRKFVWPDNRRKFSYMKICVNMFFFQFGSRGPWVSDNFLCLELSPEPLALGAQKKQDGPDPWLQTAISKRRPETAQPEMQPWSSKGQGPPNNSLHMRLKTSVDLKVMLKPFGIECW